MVKNVRAVDPFNWAERDCSFEGSVDEDGVAVSSSLDSRGRELPDPVPMSPPVGMSERPSLADFVHRMIRQEVSRAALAAEMESFDEADDFDIDDDPLDPMTPYEKHFEAEDIPADWPMYYNDTTGMYGRLPPDARPPEGFTKLEAIHKLPEGYTYPRASQGSGGGGGAQPPSGQPSAPSSGAPTGQQLGRTDTDIST